MICVAWVVATTGTWADNRTDECVVAKAIIFLHVVADDSS